MEQSVEINWADEMRYPVPFLNSTLLPMLLLSLARQKNSAQPKSTFSDEYDYIVVGGGVAGSIVASRLSEIPQVSVLLLEAGRTPPLLSDVPAVSKIFSVSDLTWGYKSTPQKYIGESIINKTLPLASGKVLGGGSGINGMITVRGNRQNYDQWAASGATGWSYEEVLPYFIKLEDNQNEEYLQNGYHGSGGPITVEKPRYDSELRRATREAALSLGYQFVDINGPRQTGLYDHQSAIRDSQRCSANKAYLAPVDNRQNLDILTRALATKINFDGKRAASVSFDYEGNSYDVRARREIVVSAGAMKTPQLLMLSGIGPMTELEKFNIPLIADLPVGMNLQNHWYTFIGYELSAPIQKFQDALKEDNNIIDYIKNRTGPLALPEGIHLVGFLNSLEPNPEADNPDVSIYITDFASSIPVDSLNLNPEVLEKFFRPYRETNTIACQLSNLYTKSIGTVTLNSRNPYEQPLVDLNAYSDVRDVEDLVRALKICRNIMSTTQMRMLGVRPFEQLLPGCEQYANDEELYLRCYVRNIILEGAHLTGTAKMGSAQDLTTVVDPELRVKNVDGLRVVDASVMPNVPWGNTYIPTAMVAEKASDMIKSALEKRKRKDLFSF